LASSHIAAAYKGRTYGCKRSDTTLSKFLAKRDVHIWTSRFIRALLSLRAGMRSGSASRPTARLRPGLKALLAEIDAARIDIVVVYKVDRLTRSLVDFAKLVERFDKHEVSFVSVTQAFNTSNSMGRLTLNVLLSFAQFEREVGAERVRDKIAASRKRVSGPAAILRWVTTMSIKSSSSMKTKRSP
jgi:DNA invertase Pin-like site-specific DNA recombinase